MNRQRDNERLLSDVLTGEDASGFREALFSETLRLARRRRRFRQARRAVPVLAVFVGLPFLVWRSTPPQVAPGEAMQRNYAIVRSQPLPAAALVLTQPVATDRLVFSFAEVHQIQTARDAGTIREIGDDELLALVEPKPAALVRRGPHSAELVVLSPAEDGTAPQN